MIKRIQTSLTMNQLAALVRLMVDTGILVPGNQTAFLKQVSDCFDLRNRTSYAAESLRQKYYQPDPPAISILRSHLANMMAKLGSY